MVGFRLIFGSSPLSHVCLLIACFLCTATAEFFPISCSSPNISIPVIIPHDVSLESSITHNLVVEDSLDPHLHHVTPLGLRGAVSETLVLLPVDGSMVLRGGSIPISFSCNRRNLQSFAAFLVDATVGRFVFFALVSLQALLDCFLPPLCFFLSPKEHAEYILNCLPDLSCKEISSTC